MRTMVEQMLYIMGIGLLCVVVFVPAAFISLVLLVFQGLPLLFRQERVGKDGVIFVMYKFRTMIVGAHNRQRSLIKYNEAHGPVFKMHNDPRFTSLGKFLAHTGFDELPQFINIIKGDMALVGPRPLPVAEAKKLSSWQQKRHTVKPGIISPWIFEGYHNTSFEAWMRSDIAYIQRKTPWGDLRLFIRACVELVRFTVQALRE
jgi:lipopolysaccharide/colanic/teichoic acid biosynthesis glycosyltransferase